MTPGATLIIDAANVVGSRPDGWWRDRAAAARRLRDLTAQLPGREIMLPREGGRGDERSGAPAALVTKVVLVVEGAAGSIATEPNPPGVHTVAAAGSGDDEVIRQARTADGPTLVVTADARLRARARGCGADVVGPGWLWDQLDPGSGHVGP